MRILLRHFTIALLPLACGAAASMAFAFSQDTCGRLVGPLFTPKCHWIQLQYQLGFQMAGTALGCVLAATLGFWMELRRRRAVQRADSNLGGPS